MNTHFLFISGQEIFIIMIIVVVVFGPKKIPEIARGLGKGMRQVKDATNDIKKEIKDSSEKHAINTNITKDINNTVADVKSGIDDITGPIKRNM